MVLTGLQNNSGSASKSGRPLAQGPRGEDVVEQADELRRVDGTAPLAGKALVREPLGPPDGTGQGGPVALTFETDDPEGAPIARRVVVHRRVEHRLPCPHAQRAAPHDGDVDVEADRVHALAQE